MDPFSLRGEVALITGGGTGIGAAMAQRMAEAGARVVVVGRREEPLRATCAAIGAAAHYEYFDVCELEAAGGLIQRIIEQHGKLSILVNNAGNHIKKAAVDQSDDDLQRLLRPHVQGAFALARTAAPHMLEARHGSILFVSSMATMVGLPLVAAYAAAKSAATGLILSLASEFGAQGVRVNGIAPGFIETDMVRGALDDDRQRRERIFQRTPLDRLGHVDDIAYAAVYLCSPAARFITGTVLTVDGGASIGF